MLNLKRFSALLVLPFLLSGCVSTSTSNLTSSQQPRNPSGLYPVEAVWESNQQSVIKESIKPRVVVGLETYPMKPTPLITNRWEALVPVPADQDTLFYHFKFDYEYQGFPERRSGSILSREYRLDIVD